MPLIAILLPDLRGGGVERMRIHLSRYFISRGYLVDFILMKVDGELLQSVHESVCVYDLKASRIRSVLVPLIRYLRERKPDVLLAGVWPLTIVAVLAHNLSGRFGRVVISDHSLLSPATIANSWFKRVVLRLSIALFYPLANGRIAVSEGVADDLVALGNLDKSTIAVIHNPAAVGRSLSESPKVQPWQGFRGKRILSVGTLKPVKDHETLIRAFALLRQKVVATLVVLGDGPLRPALERLVDELDLSDSVIMPGFVPETYPWYHGADLFALSSQYEGFGNVIVEALECGLSVVSTDCPSGPREILQDGIYGRLVPVGDVAKLASAMSEVLSSRYDRDKLMDRAKAFSVEEIAQHYLCVLIPEDDVF